MEDHRIKRQIRFLTATYMIGIAISGITAFPLHTELKFISEWFTKYYPSSFLTQWVTTFMQEFM